MPDAPDPGAVLSSTTTSAPEPRPRARSSFARWYAVERPWIPAPTTTYGERDGSVMSYRLVIAYRATLSPKMYHAAEPSRIERGEPAGTRAAHERRDGDPGRRGERDAEHAVARGDEDARRPRHRPEKRQAVRRRGTKAGPARGDRAVGSDAPAQAPRGLLRERPAPGR